MGDGFINTDDHSFLMIEISTEKADEAIEKVEDFYETGKYDPEPRYDDSAPRD